MYIAIEGDLVHAFSAAAWDSITPDERDVIRRDFRDLLLSEYDTPDPTMDHFTERQNVADAAQAYARRIGGGQNLQPYAASLLAGERRTLRMSGRMHQPDESDE
jgi:hypothetical protein